MRFLYIAGLAVLLSACAGAEREPGAEPVALRLPSFTATAPSARGWIRIPGTAMTQAAVRSVGDTRTLVAFASEEDLRKLAGTESEAALETALAEIRTSYAEGRHRLRSFEEASAGAGSFLQDAVLMDESAAKKHLSKAELRQPLEELRTTYATIEPFDAPTLEEALRRLADARGLGVRCEARPARCRFDQEKIGAGKIGSGLRQRAIAGEIAFGTIETFVAHRLTGGERHVTDVTNASRTLLMDLKERRWHSGMCELFGVPEQVLPEIVPSANSSSICRAERPVNSLPPLSSTRSRTSRYPGGCRVGSGYRPDGR